MTRVKRGVLTQKRHGKTMAATKGFRTIRHARFKLAKQAIMKALAYSYRDRKAKKREFRRLWIIRINAAVRALGGTYREFVHNLKEKEVNLDRKVLAQIAKDHPEVFSAIHSEVSK